MTVSSYKSMSIVDVAKKKARQRNYDKQIGTNDWCDVCDGGDCWIVYLEMISCHTHQIKTKKTKQKIGPINCKAITNSNWNFRKIYRYNINNLIPAKCVCVIDYLDFII